MTRSLFILKMSSSELAEAGVLGLEDYDPAESDHLDESASESEAFDAAGEFHLLAELRKVHILEELIVQENLLIRQLRCCEEELAAGEPPDANGPPGIGQEREAFQRRLEEEKREVEKLEESLDKERRAKRHEDGGARRVVKCSAMEKAGSETKEDRAICDELLSGSCRSQRTNSTPRETCSTEHLRAASGSDVAKEPQNPTSEPRDSDRLPDRQDDCFSAFHKTASDLKESPEEAGIQPRGYIPENQSDESRDGASSPSRVRPDVGAFDPGGNWRLPPEPEPGGEAPLPENCGDLAEHEHPPPSTELDPEDAAPDVGHDFVVDPNVKEPSSDDDDHTLAEKCNVSLDPLSETTTRGEDDASEVAEDVQTSSALLREQSAPRPPPDRPLKFDPGGGDERREDFADSVRGSGAMRGSGSPGIQAELNLNTREVHYVYTVMH